jgi:HAD superfamily hydrolase (TIGR01509 family)
VASRDSAAGVLFDVDGTLVDTTFIHAVCWAEALRQHGRQVTAAEVHHAVGMSSEQLLDRCLGEDADIDRDAVTDAHLTLAKQWWGRLNPLPGARELLFACHERGLRVVLASSAKDEELAALRRTLDADEAIDTATSSSDADAGKPAPDIIQAALERSGLDARHVVFVGDAVWDGYAAQRAGIPFVGLTCGGTPAAELRRSGAGEVWTDPGELLENFDKSALARIAPAAR